jgi:hypothetical protein
MTEAANVLGILAGAMLLVAFVAWLKLLQLPSAQAAGGDVGGPRSTAEIASELLFWAVAVSGLAAFLAIGGLIFS